MQLCLNPDRRFLSFFVFYDFFPFFKKIGVLWYRCYYPHRLTDALLDYIKLDCKKSENMKIRQLPDWSGNYLIKIRQRPNLSDCCLIKIRQLPDWSGNCLIKIRLMPDPPGSHHGKIRQLPDWSGSCQIKIRHLPDRSGPRFVKSLGSNINE